jgi:hypothetical protein
MMCVIEIFDQLISNGGILQINALINHHEYNKAMYTTKDSGNRNECVNAINNDKKCINRLVWCTVVGIIGRKFIDQSM